MEKIMPLELLASIKGARSSEDVAELFSVILKAVPDDGGEDTQRPVMEQAVTVENLRNDEVRECPAAQKEIIRANFPEQKDGFLVVPKVIDD
jgi:aspartyl/glutamyl-tRNA(Asn/Gln) amidotransferase C subunit